MKKLEKQVQKQQAMTMPAKQALIDALQSNLGFPLSSEYQDFLSCFGVIAHGAYETYGLGVPDDYFLNVLNAYKDLSADISYPDTAVPLLELGDGQYYLYRNQDQKVLLWATPNGGLARVLNEDLETFLLKHIFAA